MAKSNEPVWWVLFAAGGVVAAVIVPILIILVGIGMPMGWIDPEVFSYERMHGLVAYPITRLILFVIIVLPLFHAAHRLRYVMMDLGLKGLGVVLPLTCYGGAIIGTIASGFILYSF